MGDTVIPFFHSFISDLVEATTKDVWIQQAQLPRVLTLREDTKNKIKRRRHSEEAVEAKKANASAHIPPVNNKFRSFIYI